jgi:hypothetical protein
MSKRLHVNTRYSCRILFKLEFSLHIFRKIAQISSSFKILPLGADHAERQTDGHDEAYSRFSQFCKRV